MARKPIILIASGLVLLCSPFVAHFVMIGRLLKAIRLLDAHADPETVFAAMRVPVLVYAICGGLALVGTGLAIYGALLLIRRERAHLTAANSESLTN